jgi:hypothetical protein
MAMVDDREDVYSKAVRAGKRTYFFDVKSTRGRDLYLTITESKKHTHADGSATYDKHKIFLYKEDFEKFINGLQDAYEEIDRLRSNGYAAPSTDHHAPMEEGERIDPITAEEVSPFTNINFEDLDRKDL